MTEQQIIKKYPEIFKDINKKGSPYCGMSVPEEWLPIIERLCFSIQNSRDNICRGENDFGQSFPQVRVDQIKEKFGSLRFYYHFAEEHESIIQDSDVSYINGMIEMCNIMCLAR